MKDGAELLAPQARASGLVVRELDDEVLIYDLKQDKAHVLNRTAGLVWKHCDGQTTVAEVQQLLEKELGEAVGIDTVWHALFQLGDDGLLEERVSPPATPRVISRRRMIQRVGMAAAAASITSIAIPTAAMAACANTNVCGAGCSTANCSTFAPAGTACNSCSSSGIGSCSHHCCIAPGTCVVGASGNQTTGDCAYCCGGQCNNTACGSGSTAGHQCK